MNRRFTQAAASTAIRTWYERGLQAVDPILAVQRSIDWDGRRIAIGECPINVDAGARIAAVSVGKAATAMARGLAETLGSRLSHGIILTRDGHATQPPVGWDVYEASHPVPDERGEAATRTILAGLGSLDPRDIAIVLASGGGSALLEAPRQGVTLQDIQEVTRLLLHAGAPIQHLNAVRCELSRVKGGGLRRVIGRATCISLILSDVLGNDPAVIASGPTIAREHDPQTSLDLLGVYGIANQVPQGVIELLRSGSYGDKPPDTTRDCFQVIGDNDAFVDGIARQAGHDGFHPQVVMRQSEGEARELAKQFLDLIAEQPANVDVVLGGGEATVTVRGDGVGGRNTEFCLAASLLLAERELDWIVASLASDGQDGSIDAAGAIVDRQTVAQGLARGLDAREYLANNDSGRYFEALGLLLKPGPTGTNVNDVYLAVRLDRSPE